jgi:DNA polymerase-3 subunit delta'
MSVWEQVVGQPEAVAVLTSSAAVAASMVDGTFAGGPTSAVAHAWLFTGPPGSGRSVAARAFAAALVCDRGGCGECRACHLALGERHPNVFVVEPEGRDIHVDTVREGVWHPAYRTAPEPGRKVFLIREADRLNPAAADVLLKVLEEPPADAVIILLSARPDELPETVASRCHVVTFMPLPETFVVHTLEEEGVAPDRARLAARLAGGNLGRARRLVGEEGDGLAFRDAALAALAETSRGPAGALNAADIVLAASAEYRKGLKDELARDVEQFTDDRGRPEDAYRGVVRRLEERHKRRVRRAERDYIDWVLLAVSSILRDRVLSASGGPPEDLINLDIGPQGNESAAEAARAMGAVEEARAALADETNLNPRLVLEQAFLRLAS